LLPDNAAASQRRFIVSGVVMKTNKKKGIFIVDDDAEMTSLLKDYLKEDGYEVYSAENGSEALILASKNAFDLIITDIRMPGLTGMDILPGLRKLRPGVPIIAITAFGSLEMYHKSLGRGATAYLEKPICLNQLGRLIQELMNP
jgi:DNA-binding NtrC family response regulator